MIHVTPTIDSKYLKDALKRLRQRETKSSLSLWWHTWKWVTCSVLCEYDIYEICMPCVWKTPKNGLKQRETKSCWCLTGHMNESRLDTHTNESWHMHVQTHDGFADSRFRMHFLMQHAATECYLADYHSGIHSDVQHIATHCNRSFRHRSSFRYTLWRGWRRSCAKFSPDRTKRGANGTGFLLFILCVHVWVSAGVYINACMYSIHTCTHSRTARTKQISSFQFVWVGLCVYVYLCE